MSITHFFLRQLQPLYWVGDFFHRLLIKQKNVAAVVISVGNISAGGTGKTPLVMKIASIAADMKLSPAIVTRGYGAKNRNPRIIGKEESSLQAGDEIVQYKIKVPESRVILSRDRFKGAEIAVREGSRAVLIDDGFQSRELGRDLDIVLLDASADNIFRREPMRSLKRADVIILSRTTTAGKEKTEELLRIIYRYALGKKIYKASERLTGMFYANEMTLEHVADFQELRSFSGFIAVSAIGNPKGFYSLLESSGLCVIKKFQKQDHYRWNNTDIAGIMAFANSKKMKVITTMKDYVKIRECSGFEGYVTDIEVIIENEADFNKTVFNVLSRQ